MENQISQKNESVQNHPALSILMVIVFGVLAISPTYFWGMPVGADFDNHFRFALPFYNEIADGNYPIVALSLRFWWTRIKQKRIRPIHLPLLLAFAFAFLYTAQGLVFDSEYTSRDKFLQRIEEVRGGRSFNNWLPRGANELKDLSPLDGKVAAGGRKISVINWQSHRRIFSVDAGAETTARVRSYYYPLWQASVLKDGQKTPTPVSQAADGTLLVALPPDSVTVEIVFFEPPRTKISFIIAALGWLATFALLITSFYKKNH